MKRNISLLVLLLTFDRLTREVVRAFALDDGILYQSGDFRLGLLNFWHYATFETADYLFALGFIAVVTTLGLMTGAHFPAGMVLIGVLSNNWDMLLYGAVSDPLHIGLVDVFFDWQNAADSYIEFGILLIFIKAITLVIAERNVLWQTELQFMM